MRLPGIYKVGFNLSLKLEKSKIYNLFVLFIFAIKIIAQNTSVTHIISHLFTVIVFNNLRRLL